MTEIIHLTDTSTPEGLVFQAHMESLGWLILTHSQIDAAFSEFIGHFMVRRSELGMMETVFTGMTINAKVEILKAFCRSEHGKTGGGFKEFGLALCEDIERASFKRNIAAHGVPWHNPKGREGLKLDSTAKWLHKNRERYVLFFDTLLAEVSAARDLLQLLNKLNAAWKLSHERDEIEEERPMMEFVQATRAIFEADPV